MKWKWKCPLCTPKGYRFSNIVGTIFGNPNVNLRDDFA
jgi:hypothetical protein